MFLLNILSLKNSEYPQLLVIWFCKIVAAISLGLIYQYYYLGGDTLSLFQDGKQLYDIAKNDFNVYVDIVLSTLLGNKSNYNDLLASSNPRAVFMSIYNSLIIAIVGKNYWLVSFFSATFHFIISYMLVKQLNEKFLLSKSRLYVAFIFFPSVLFWSSGLLKENLLTAGLYLCIILYLNIQNDKLKLINRLYYFVSLVLLLYLLFRLKYYYIAVFTPLLFAHYFAKKSHSMLDKSLNENQTKYVQVILLILIFSSLIAFATITHPNLRADFVLQAVVTNNLKMVAETSDKSNLIVYNELTEEPISFFKNIPYATFQGLVRPYIWESGNIFKKYVAFENLLVVIMLAYALFKVYAKDSINNRYFLETISIILFSVIMLVLLSMATPNLGTLARYKVGFLPFLILIIWPSQFKINLQNWALKK